MQLPGVEPGLLDDIAPLSLGLVPSDKGRHGDRGGGAQGPSGVLAGGMVG